MSSWGIRSSQCMSLPQTVAMAVLTTISPGPALGTGMSSISTLPIAVFTQVCIASSSRKEKSASSFPHRAGRVKAGGSSTQVGSRSSRPWGSRPTDRQACRTMSSDRPSTSSGRAVRASLALIQPAASGKVNSVAKEVTVMTQAAERLELAVAPRQVLGKKVRFLRRQGVTPANIYGHGADSLAVQVPTHDLTHTIKVAGRNTMLQVLVEGEKKARPVFAD